MSDGSPELTAEFLKQAGDRIRAAHPAPLSAESVAEFRGMLRALVPAKVAMPPEPVVLGVLSLAVGLSQASEAGQPPDAPYAQVLRALAGHLGMN